MINGGCALTVEVDAKPADGRGRGWLTAALSTGGATCECVPNPEVREVADG